MEMLLKFISFFLFLYSNILLSQGGENVLSVLFFFFGLEIQGYLERPENCSGVWVGLKLQSFQLS